MLIELFAPASFSPWILHLFRYSPNHSL